MPVLLEIGEGPCCKHVLEPKIKPVLVHPIPSMIHIALHQSIPITHCVNNNNGIPDYYYYYYYSYHYSYLLLTTY